MGLSIKLQENKCCFAHIFHDSEYGAPSLELLAILHIRIFYRQPESLLLSANSAVETIGEGACVRTGSQERTFCISNRFVRLRSIVEILRGPNRE